MLASYDVMSDLPRRTRLVVMFSITDCGIYRRAERIVIAEIDLLLQEVGAHPAIVAVAALLGLAARTLRRDFPVPVVEIATQTKHAAQIVGLDVPGARAGIDGAKATDQSMSLAHPGTGCPDCRRNRKTGRLVERRRRALCKRLVVLNRQSR